MKLDIYNIQGQATGRSIEMPDDIFGIEPNEHSVYLAVKQYLAHQRQGTHKARERSEMSGSTRKLHRQKGTGGSRKGDINNPLYRGGGRVFGPKPHDYVINLNKKVKRLARKSALSAKMQSGQIMVIEDFTFETPKTRSYLDILRGLKLEGKKTLLVTPDLDEKVYLSVRNIPKAGIAVARDLNTYQVMNTQALILSESAVSKIKETF